MLIAIVIILLVVGSIIFHFLSPWWMTPLASNWVELDNALILTFWITGVVFIAVNLFLAYAVLRFRHREGQVADYEPENSSLEKWLTVLTSIGIAGLLAPGLAAWQSYISVPKDAAVVEVIGQRWQWTYRFPGADGVLGTADGRLIDSARNPFGLNPGDPFGKDDILVSSSELHLPINQPYKFVLRSKDVLHDFYIPHFRAKMDMVPGTVTYFWAEPTRLGTFDVLCAELCGVGHHSMKGTVVVQEQADFEAWLSEWPTFADEFIPEDTDETTGDSGTS